MLGALENEPDMKTRVHKTKSGKRIHKDCKVTQKKVVFDFLGGYHTLLEQEIHSLTANHRETISC